jgi:nucleoside-diphosphate-sugar epimerase
MATILITGVNGFVGSAVFRHLSAGHTVYGIYHTGETLSERCFKADLRNAEDCAAVFDTPGLKIDVLIHLASRMASAANLQDVSVLQDNALMTYNIGMAAKNKNVKQVIYFSSSSVYANESGTYKEESPITPSRNTDAIYGLSKFNGEELLNALYQASDTVLTHLRAGMIYGPGMDATRIFGVLEAELARENTLTLYGNGERLLNLITVGQLCEVLAVVINRKAGGVFNVCEETISLRELAERIIKQKGNAASRILYKEEGNRKKFILDTTKLKQLLHVQTS